MHLRGDQRDAQGGEHHETIVDGGDGVVGGLGQEDRWAAFSDVGVDGKGIGLFEGRHLADEDAARRSPVEGRAQGDDGIDQAREVRPRRERVALVDRCIDSVRTSHRGFSHQVAAGGEAEHADPLRIDGIVGRSRPYHAQGALHVLQWRLGTCRPAFPRQAVDQHEGGDAGGCEPIRDGHALVADVDAAIAAAGCHDHGGPVGIGGPHHKQAGSRHVGDDAFPGLVKALVRGDRATAAGGKAGPEVDDVDIRPRSHSRHMPRRTARGMRLSLGSARSRQAGGEAGQQVAAADPHADPLAGRRDNLAEMRWRSDVEHCTIGISLTAPAWRRRSRRCR